MSSTRPIIGVSGDLSVEKDGKFPGYRSTFVYEDYIESVEQAGGVPFVIPVTTDEAVIKEQAAHIDGLLLTGGEDVNPLEYGEEPQPKQGAIFPERDTFEIALVRAVLDVGKPVFAICRGIQILNIAYGGTLYQDLSYKAEDTLKHQQASSRPSSESHTVHVEKDSYIYKVFGDTVRTNSFHHQAIKDVAKGFKITAESEDGVVEGIEKADNPAVIGVQWHPERMADEHQNMLQLFEHLVTESKSA